MKNIALIVSQILLLGLAFTSCSKDEGKGGDAKIAGLVYKVTDDGDIVHTSTGYAFKRDTSVAIDEDVFIIYGGGTGAYDDKTSTNGEGLYEFDYLRSGDYTIYAIEDGENGNVPVYRTINIGDDGTNCVDNFYLMDGKNTGKCGLVGHIEAMYNKADDYQPGIGLRVYLQKADESDESDTRADENGNFKFSKLDSNSWYLVYAETEPVKNGGIQTVSFSFCTGAAGTITDATTSNVLKVTVY